MPRYKSFDDQARAPKRSYVAYTEKDDATIIAMCEQGASLGEIAKVLKRSPSSIHGRARRIGASFRRDKPGGAEAMVSVQRVDNAARLAELASRLIDEAGAMLDEIHTPQPRVERGRVEPGVDGPVEFVEPRPPARDRLGLMQAAVLAMREARAAHESQAATTAGADIDRWLAHMGGSPDATA